jgi:hypothetical protein
VKKKKDYQDLRLFLKNLLWFSARRKYAECLSFRNQLEISLSGLFFLFWLSLAYVSEPVGDFVEMMSSSNVSEMLINIYDPAAPSLSLSLSLSLLCVCVL